MNRIKFTLPDVGLREVKGLVYVHDGHLVLEVEDAIVGLVDTDKTTIEIEPEAVKRLYVKPGLFKHKLVIEPYGPELLDALPGQHARAAELRIWRTERPAIDSLIDEFESL